jgi:hypothetical protein
MLTQARRVFDMDTLLHKSSGKIKGGSPLNRDIQAIYLCLWPGTRPETQDFALYFRRQPDTIKTN